MQDHGSCGSTQAIGLGLYNADQTKQQHTFYNMQLLARLLLLRSQLPTAENKKMATPHDSQCKRTIAIAATCRDPPFAGIELAVESVKVRDDCIKHLLGVILRQHRKTSVCESTCASLHRGLRCSSHLGEQQQLVNKGG